MPCTYFSTKCAASVLSNHHHQMQAEGVQLSGRTGTLMYMAPEVYLKQQYDDKADVFSFGVVAYEVLHRYMMISATDGSLEECMVRR